MSPAEATARSEAAMARIGKAQPLAGLAIVVVLAIGALFRLLVHLCIGFGAASVAGVSAWWGLPLALLSVQTVGRVWVWLRRDSRVRALEEAADRAEREAS